MADPGVVLGFPYQQLNSESGSFRYAGMSPEEAIQQQRLNRRQQIANLLIQRGLGQPQGQMAGRFYVPPSPLQGVANLALLGAGLYGTNKLGEEERDLQEKSRQATAEAVRKYRDLDQPIAVEGIAQGPGAPIRTQVSGPPPSTVDAQGNYLVQDQEGREHYPTDSPSLSVPNPQLPGGPVPQAIAAGGLERSVPEFQAATPVIQKTEGPLPTGTEMVPLDAATRRARLAELLATANPQAQQAIRLAEMMRQHEADQTAGREEKAMDRDVRRQGQLEQAAMRLATLENTMAMKQMQLAQDERAGIRNDNLRRDIQASQEEMKKLQLEIEQRRIEAQAEERARRDKEAAELKRELAQQNIQARKDIAGMQQEDKRARREEKQDQVFAEGAARFSEHKASIDNMLSNIQALRTHPGMSRITGAMGAIPNFPGSDASNAQALLESLRSKTAAQAIQDLRAMSKTGGAVGQVTEKEWPRLENMLAALDTKQSPEAFGKALDDLAAYVDGMQARLAEAFRRQYGDRATEILGAPSAPATSSPAPGKVRKYNPATGKIE